MRDRTRKTLDSFSSKFKSNEQMMEEMQSERAEVFKSDPDMADIVYHFADAFVDFGEEMLKNPPLSTNMSEVIPMIMGKTNAERMMKNSMFATVIITMLKNLADGGIITIVPKHKRIAREILQGIKGEKQHEKVNSKPGSGSVADGDGDSDSGE